jgi:putative nucleotidyltransferase with HDIG domain
LNDPHIFPYLEQLKNHHPDTHTHSVRVGLLALDLGLENGLEEDDLSVLGAAGLLHDIGKIHISARLLSKRERLEAHEREILRDHSRLGCEILRNFHLPEVPQIVAAHHAYGNHPVPNLDYYIPITGAEGESLRPGDARLDMMAQIVAAADMCDALLHRRAYKNAYTGIETAAAMQVQYRGDSRYLRQLERRYTSGFAWA